MKNAGANDPNKSRSLARVPLFEDLTKFECSFFFEEEARRSGFRNIAGLDEVGRGCLAGPVIAGACILDIDKPVPKGLNDSKKLTAKQRDEISSELKIEALAYSVGVVEADEIDRINILEATKLAMARALENLSLTADHLLIDALQLKHIRIPQKALIKGDGVSYSIAAASVIAKVFRDDLMKQYDREFPQYGFAGHKGYGCASHFAALKEHGPCPIHRKTFRGVVQSDAESSGIKMLSILTDKK